MNSQYGRTKYDWISENPKKAFYIFITMILILLALLIIIITLKIPIKYKDFQVGVEKANCDTIRIVEHDTIYVTKLKYVSEKNSDNEKKIPTKEINVTSNNQQGGQTGNEINNN